MTFYRVESEKIKKQSIKMAVVSDLHNVQLGKKNEDLLGRIRTELPDVILIAGDLVLGKPSASFENAFCFLKEIV